MELRCHFLRSGNTSRVSSALRPRANITLSGNIPRRTFIVKQRLPRLAFGCSLALVAFSTTGAAVADIATATAQPTASVVLDPTHQLGGAIPERFMGISIEWTLIERYMNPNAQPAFVNLLRNWDSGFIRVGGGSQDSTPYSADAPNTDSIVTNADFALLRTTIDALN